MNKFLKSFILTFFVSVSLASHAQDEILKIALEEPDSVVISVSDSLLMAHANDIDIFDNPLELPDVFFMPAIYDHYAFFKPLTIEENTHAGKEWQRWLEDYDVLYRRMKMMRQSLFFEHPEVVQYNIATLPEAPAPYVTVLDPKDFSISVREDITPAAAPTLTAEEVKKRHWIRNFSASLQFSQAYVSPNWYQGGNNALNALASIVYNVKLNDALHPNLLFETNFQYKLGINSAPEDTVHAYNITEDILQINTTFGIKAVKHWYYSLTGQFKTQVLNSYATNSHNLASAFMSPGELTAGIGMTYTFENPKKTFGVNASIAPVSYHLITCLNHHMNPANYGIKDGRRAENQFGSTVDMTLKWKIAYNISLNSHLFAFTDYHSVQADWENTLAFAINSFLTTQIYAHLRYDSQTNPIPDTRWKKLQVKEIFSIGFAYKFSSL